MQFVEKQISYPNLYKNSTEKQVVYDLQSMQQQTNNSYMTIQGQAPWRVALGTWLLFYLSQHILLLVGLNGELYLCLY